MKKGFLIIYTKLHAELIKLLTPDIFKLKYENLVFEK